MMINWQNHVAGFVGAHRSAARALRVMPQGISVTSGLDTIEIIAGRLYPVRIKQSRTGHWKETEIVFL